MYEPDNRATFSVDLRLPISYHLLENPFSSNILCYDPSSLFFLLLPFSNQNSQFMPLMIAPNEGRYQIRSAPGMESTWKIQGLMPAIDPGRDYHRTVYGNSECAQTIKWKKEDADFPVPWDIWAAYVSRLQENSWKRKNIWWIRDQINRGCVKWHSSTLTPDDQVQDCASPQATEGDASLETRPPNTELLVFPHLPDWLRWHQGGEKIDSAGGLAFFRRKGGYFWRSQILLSHHKSPVFTENKVVCTVHAIRLPSSWAHLVS